MEIIKPRTRFAPSPTGMLHLGNANTALFNWIIARRYGGTVVLRIEDTDTERSTEDFEKSIIEDLKWMGIEWDEGPDTGGAFGPYRQKERGDIYREYLDKLLDAGRAYRCYCTKEELDSEREKAKAEKRDILYSGKCRNLTPEDWTRLDGEGKAYTIRFAAPEGETVSFNDLIRGEISKDAAEFGDFIIVRSNGAPVFLITNAVDDALMEISHVVRGEDHISNTHKQVLLFKALGFDVPSYLHTSMILGQDRTKLSKRHGAVSVRQFRDDGYLPEAMTNYLAFLGWNPKDEREIFSLEELVDVFSVEAMSKGQSVFDYGRIKHINDQWMMKVGGSRVMDMCLPVMKEKGWIGDSGEDLKKAERIIEILGDRIKNPADIVEQADFFFEDFDSYDEKGAGKHFKGAETVDMLNMLRDRMGACDNFTEKGLEDLFRGIIEEMNIKFKVIVHPLRLALSGRTVGPGIFELIETLGKEKCLLRLESAAAWIEKQ